jgi:hypothetical protein
LHGDFTVIHTAKFPDAGVGGQFGLILHDEIVQVHAGDFFFALDHEFDVAGQFTVLGQQRVDGVQARDKVAFVVADAASVEFAVALGWFERRGLPEFQRFRGLDIVVVVEQQGFVATFALALPKNTTGAPAVGRISTEKPRF